MDNRPIYKTAVQLGIEERTRQGLIVLAGELASGLIPYDLNRRPTSSAPKAFNMNWECGSACCIRGWLEHRKELDTVGLAIDALFYPREVDGGEWDDITPLQASRAIYNFLTLGVPCWADAVVDVTA